MRSNRENFKFIAPMFTLHINKYFKDKKHAVEARTEKMNGDKNLFIRDVTK